MLTDWGLLSHKDLSLTAGNGILFITDLKTNTANVATLGQVEGAVTIMSQKLLS